MRTLIDRYRRHRARTSRGQALTEFALVLPVLVLVIGGIIQFGIIFWGQNSLNQIVRDTGRWAATQTTCIQGNPAVITRANLIASQSSLIGYGGSFPASEVHYNTTPGGPPYAAPTPCPPIDKNGEAWVNIKISHDVPIFFPFIPGNGTDHFDDAVPSGAPAMINLARFRRLVHEMHETTVPRRGASGQSLVLFALMLVVLLGFAALAIDVTRVYADMRFYRATADAAALAGAQDLQGNNTRAVGTADYTRARGHALASLEQQLGGSRCGLWIRRRRTSSIVRFRSSLHIACRSRPSVTELRHVQPSRAVQVTVRRPAYPLSFARIPPFNQTDWNVQTTSVAGLHYGRSYAIITLRPPTNTDGPHVR